MKKIFTLFMMVMALSFSSQAAYYLVGNPPFGNGWDPSDGIEMTMNADGTYGYKGTINGSIWFVLADGLAEAGDWATFNNTLRIGPTGGDETVTAGQWVTCQKSEGDHGAYKFTGSGDEYVITFNPFINKFKIDGNVEEIPITVYTVAGAPAAVFGTEWDPTNADNDMVEQENGMFELNKYGIELAAGTELLFKVVGNRDWGTCWPDDNFSLAINESGSYNLRFSFDPVTKFCGVQASFVNPIDPRTGNLFVLGEVNGNTWGPNVGYQLTTEDQNIFTGTIVTNGENPGEDGIGYSYFSFTTMLGEDWGDITAYRIGASDNDYLLSEDQLGIELPLAGFGTTNSYKIVAGTYDVTVNLDAMTVMITKNGGEEPGDEINIVKDWEITDLSFLTVGDVRQGFGMGGKFYINDKATQTIYVVDQNGKTETTYPGGANCGITRDEAGNLIVSNATFPDAWVDATIKVINPETNEMKEYAVPVECGLVGRCDFIGFAKGNLMEEGTIYLAGATTAGVSILNIVGGEVSVDDSFLAYCDGLSPTSSTVINYYKDLNGEDAWLYVTRNAALQKLAANGDDFVATATALPNKGACNGTFAFLWEDKEFFVYPTLPNYLDGFAVAEANAEAPIVEVEATAAANANAYQADWLNAEVNEDGTVTIYQYYPGGKLAVYTLVKGTIEPQEVTATPVISYEVTDDAVIITVTGDGEVHVYVNGEEVENPYTIPRGEEDVTVVVTATAQEEGKLISETATEEIVVPAKVVEPEEGYEIEKLWSIDDLSFLTVADVRQGFGMNGKFYINDKATQTIYVVDENGKTETTYPGGANCGITRDEAGNLIVSNATFPDAWVDATIKVINPETNEMKEYAVPVECGLVGRCDFIGFAKGNLMEEGTIYLAGATTAGVSILNIVGGEVSVDDSFLAYCDGLSPTSSTVINYYKDLNGEDAWLYVTRNAALQKLAANGDDFVATATALPNKGACNGTFAFLWEDKEFFVYPTLPNYLDGFAVAEANAEAPIVEVEATAAANANAYQADWLNAEVNENGTVTIYQYYPGGKLAVYILKKATHGVEELINDNTEKVVANVRYYNIMGQEMTEANGLTIIVTTYTDGSHNAVKVIK